MNRGTQPMLSVEHSAVYDPGSHCHPAEDRSLGEPYRCPQGTSGQKDRCTNVTASAVFSRRDRRFVLPSLLPVPDRHGCSSAADHWLYLGHGRRRDRRRCGHRRRAYPNLPRNACTPPWLKAAEPASRLPPAPQQPSYRASSPSAASTTWHSCSSPSAGRTSTSGGPTVRTPTCSRAAPGRRPAGTG